MKLFENKEYYKQKYSWKQIITILSFIIAIFDFAVIQTYWLGVLLLIFFFIMAMMGYVRPNKIK